MTDRLSTVGLAVAAAITAAGLVCNLSGYALLDPDEGRNAEVAREMAAQNDYVLPRLNGLPYLDKPALFFAAGAVSMEVLGPTVAAARLPSLLFTLATLAVAAWLAARLFGTAAVWPAVIASAATPFTLAYSRTVIFDSALTLWVLVALAGFFLACESGEGDGVGPAGAGEIDDAAPPMPPRSPAAAGWWPVVGWAAVALGILTKGPVALALPLLVAVPYAAWRRRLRVLFDPVGMLLCVALLLPWVMAVSRQVPGFLRHALVTETARRLVTTDLGRTGPWWYFLAILPAATLPWSVLVAAACVGRRRTPGRWDRRFVFLVLWIVVPLAFFTLSQSKRPQYMLPLVPAVGLLVGALWREARAHLPGTRAAAIALLVLGACLLAGGTLIPGLLPAARPEVARHIPHTAVLLGIAGIVGGAIAWIGVSLPGVALCGLALPVMAIPLVSTDLMQAVGRDRSAEELAHAIAQATGDEAEIVGVQAYPPSLPFYLRRTITLATADGSELTSNFLAADIARWRHVPNTTIRPADWWRDALDSCRRPRVFVVRTGDTAARILLDGRLSLIVETRKYAAYGPCGTSPLAAASSVAVLPSASP